MSLPVEKKVDALFADFVGTNTPGATVIVIKGGQILFSKAYGMADIERQVPCSTNTNFRLASVTKQFTAMAVMIQAERKKLSLDDPIVKFFPTLPAYARPITVRQLLTHSSGLLDYEGLIPAGTTKQLKDKDVLRLVCEQDKTYFPSGSKFRYSNTGYAFLALIVEVTSGKTFAEFLKQNIFDPLEMSNTVAFEEGISAVKNRAMGYAKEKNKFVFSDQSVASAVLGDGGIYSSTVDLFKWDQALYTEKLVSKRMLQEAFSKASPTSDMPGSGYGFGWYVGKHRECDCVWHYGSTCGFATRLARVPAKQLTVIVLANRRKTDLTDTLPQLIDMFW